MDGGGEAMEGQPGSVCVTVAAELQADIDDTTSLGRLAVPEMPSE